MDSLPERKKSTQLKKHINAIHSSNNLTLVQRKLINVLLFNAYHELPKKSVFSIGSKQLCELIGYNSNDYGLLKRSLLGLIKTTIEWNVIEFSDAASSEKWAASSILAAAKLENGTCTYEYSSVMRELLHHPEIYGKIHIETQAKFNSTYGLALYENCVRYQDLPQTPWFQIETFRKLMGVVDDKYPHFRDFKRRVIEPAVKEVNRYSDIDVAAELKRMSRKVIAIRFKLSKEKQINNDSHFVGAVEKSLFDERVTDVLLNDFKLTPKTIEGLINNYSVEYIKDKVALIKKSHNYRANKIHDIAGYLISALRDDYQPKCSAGDILRDKNLKKIETSKAEEVRVAKQREIYDAYVTKCIETALSNLDEEFQKRIYSSFEEHVRQNADFVYQWYKDDGLQHPAVKAHLKEYVLIFHGGILDYQTYDEYFSSAVENN